MLGKYLGEDRRLLRTDLFPVVRSKSALFFATLLVAIYHESFISGAAPNVQFVAWVRHMALGNINDGLRANRPPSHHIIAAVSIRQNYSLGKDTDP